MSESLEEIQQRFIEELSRSNSPVTDVSRGSALYALSRAFSHVLVDYQQKQKQLLKDSWFVSAEGEALERFLATFNIFRDLGALASGKALFSTEESAFTITPNTLLADGSDNHFYMVNIPNNVIIHQGLEIALDIISINNSSLANKPAGTRLFINATEAHSVAVFIGSHRNELGECCNGLTGGKDAEPDYLLRQKLIDLLGAKNSLNPTIVKQLVSNYLNLRGVRILTQVPGIIEVFIPENQINDKQLVEIENFLKLRIPAGILVSAKPIRLIPLTFDIDVKSNVNYNFNDLYQDISELITVYLDELEMGQRFVISDLERYLRNRIERLNITSPSSLLPLKPYELYTLGTLKVRYIASN